MLSKWHTQILSLWMNVYITTKLYQCLNFPTLVTDKATHWNSLLPTISAKDMIKGDI